MIEGIRALPQRLTDFPMMAEGIDDASDAPAVLIADWINFLRTGLDGAGKNSIGIGRCHDDAHRNSAERFRAIVVMLGRFVAEPELRAGNGQLGNHAAATIKSKDLYRTKGCFVELDRASTTSKA